MKTMDITAKAVVLETPEEVRLVSGILEDYYEDGYMTEPENETFAVFELKDHLEIYFTDSGDPGWAEEYPEAFRQLVDFINDLPEDTAVQFKLTEEMREKIEEILPEMSDDEFTDEEDE